MESSQQPVSSASNTSTHPRGNTTTKAVDDITSLTSFNPFSQEDEHDQSSYTLVTSILSRVKNSLAAPLSSAASQPVVPNNTSNSTETRRASTNASNTISPNPLKTLLNDKAPPFKSFKSSNSVPAPPVVSFIPVVPEFPTYNETAPSRNGQYFTADGYDGGPVGTAIPGFPIPDDARSIHTATSLKKSASKVIRKIRGEGLSRDYWMDDENCKECYDCKSVFSTWRRKHHCRICGQIFCSRCASNIIPGSRFGHDGMIRICNLCLEKLHINDDDDDDRRSIISTLTSSFPTYPGDGFSQSPLGFYSLSPHSGSQFFARNEDPINFFTIAENRRRLAASDGSGFNSRPLTPWEDNDQSFIDAIPTQAAPFRRSLGDEDKENNAVSEAFNQLSPSVSRDENRDSANDTVTLTLPTDSGTSSIQFPGSDDGPQSPGPYGILRTRIDSSTDDIPTPFLRSRVQSRLGQFWGEPGWRTRRESTAYAQELNLISMFHLRVMLRQLLTSEGISNVKEWEETLLKISLRIARDLTFTALPHRDGADMDVRRYVKIKKIPGGSPHDSEYVDGAVITKNVAHKRMSRYIRNPRVMLVAFSLDFQRVEGKYVHFGQIALQEKEYLGNLASRIAALRPHIVLVEKSISRLVLETLEKQKIAVATMVKKRAIDFVSRMTQGDTFASMDMLALEPRLGHCSHLRVQTFDHPMIPGRRKTYMRFEGCSRDLGCTIILRGGDISELTRVKKVARFITFIVRNLKLETHLWKDSVITLPHLTTEAVPASMIPQLQPLSTLVNSSFTPSTLYTNISSPRGQDALVGSGSNEDDLCADDAESLRLSRRIRQSLEPYLKTFISVSATLRFAPPYPIRRMVELDVEVQARRTAWEDDIIRKEENVERRASLLDQSTPLNGFDYIESHPAEVQCTSPDVEISTTPRLEDSLHQVNHNTTGSSSHSSLNSLKNTPSLPSKELDRPLVLRDVSDITLESDLDLIKRQHDEQRRIWEWYLRKNKDDFVVDKYQRISLLEFTIPIDQLTQRRSCFPPQFHYITFYGDNDCTLGQFIERSVRETLVQFLDPKAVCEGKGCNEPLARHCKVFVHNESRLIIHVEQWAKDIKTRNNLSPQPTTLTTWSACRICGSVTPFIPVSEEMSRYSFAKFLELFFYPADVQLVQGAGCAHNIYQHHIRYFAVKGMTICVQTDPITLFEVIYPPSRIKVRSQTLLQLKNMDCEALLAKNMRWYSALIDDLRLINIDAASGDEESDSRLNSHINALINKAEVECREITRLIHNIYSESSPVDTLALNQVRAQRQDYIVAWQQDFDTLPKPKAYQPPEKETRRVSAFGSVRAMWPRRIGPQEFARPASASVSEVEDNPMLPRRSTIESATSAFSASDVSEPEPDSSTEQLIESIPREGATPLASEPTETNTTSRSDAESDSTIGASRHDVTENPLVAPDQEIAADVDVERALQIQSRLPRRSGQHPSVAELVQRYQDFLPASVSSVLAVTAFPPPVPPLIEESDVDTDARPIRRRPQKTAAPPNKPPKELQSSDLEGSYTANIAPRYLAHRRPSGIPSRIPGPIASSFESRESSRRASPDKRAAVPSRDGGHSLRGAKQRVTSRPTNRDKIRNVSGGKPVFRRTSTSGPGNRVSNIARHFERMSRDSDRANRRYAVIRGRRARPVASARATVEVLDSVREAIKDESDHSSDSSSVADDEDEDEDDREHAKKSTSLSTDDTGKPSILEVDQAHRRTLETNTAEPCMHGNNQASDGSMGLPPSTPPLTSSYTVHKPLSHETPPTLDTETTVGGSERHSTLMKALSGLWPPQLQQTRQETETEDPLDDPEHIFRESSMIVRTDEPTSIIALALNSPQYREMLARSRAEKRQVREAKITEGGEAFMPDDQSVSETNSTWGVVNLDATDDGNPTEDLRMPSSKSPWAISFESGGLTITCTILYPEQFDALRRTFDCERSLIESLARCIKWNANGGKSGSAFLKTRDDRFIAKELSRAELETMETFGPAYFDYMSSAFTAERPTLLAKVLGCYKLVFRKAYRGKEKPGRSRYTQMNLLVMENLFYDRRFSKIFDLKGSTRNRHVQSTGQENEVLLDENLVEIAHISPFYVREHSKRILRGALYNDSRFLADINVMDYSLVVGVDNEKNELVVGIVDYIRTYTWDKKLESWVKESAFLGGAGKGEPTIITPKQYRQRFISAMERYFPLVPDRWMKQNDAPEEEGNSLLDLWPDW